jgi:hypothetical protein
VTLKADGEWQIAMNGWTDGSSIIMIGAKQLEYEKQMKRTKGLEMQMNA